MCKGDNDIEQQLKVHRLQLPAFGEGGASKTLPQSPSDYDTVELGPGDTLYHPAGIWHQVEATEDSISINFSLLGTSLADFTADAVRHLLWTASPLRSTVVVQGYKDARQHVAEKLAAAKALVTALQPEQLLPPCVLPSMLCDVRGGFGRTAMAFDVPSD